MATKRKKRGHHTRRRRVGAAAHSGIETAIIRFVSAGAGAAVGAFIIQAGNTALGANVQPWMVPAGVAVTGGIIPMVAKGNEFATDFSMGLVAVGTLFTLNETFLSIPGISGMAMTSNAPQNAMVMRKAVGQGPNAYLNRSVGRMGYKDRLKTVGALMTN